MRKITIITGASSGLGAEFARQLYKAETMASADQDTKEFWLIARNSEKTGGTIKSITSECGTKNGISLRNFPMDISGRSGIEAFRETLEGEKKNGEYKIDTLVNNAGFGTYGEFTDTPLEKEIDMVDLNCASLTGICGLCIPLMEKGSSIINVSSLAAFLPLGNFAVYAATKSYVLSFSVALAAELRDRGIKVTALCPGSVSTNFANVASNGARKEVLHGKSPEKVVAHCIKKARKGERIVLWAFKWKFTAFMSRFIGRYFGARFTFLHNKRPYRHE